MGRQHATPSSFRAPRSDKNSPDQTSTNHVLTQSLHACSALSNGTSIQCATARRNFSVSPPVFITHATFSSLFPVSAKRWHRKIASELDANSWFGKLISFLWKGIYVQELFDESSPQKTPKRHRMAAETNADLQLQSDPNTTKEGLDQILGQTILISVVIITLFALMF